MEMDTGRWEKLQNMVLGAKELPSEAQDDYLQKASQGDEILFDKASQILRSYQADSGFLSNPVGSVEALLASSRKKDSGLFGKLFGWMGSR